MNYHPVVDQFRLPTPLDPLWATIFVAAFAAIAYATAKRPALGACALIITAPFAFYHEVTGVTLTLGKVALLGVLAGLTAHRPSWRELARPPMRALLLALSLYIVALGLSAFAAPDLGAALQETVKGIQYALVAIAAFLCYRIDPDDRAIAWTWGLVAIAVALTALAQEAIGAPSALCIGNAVIPRIAGVLEGPNQLGGFFEVAVAALAAWNVRDRSRLIAIALALAACADVLTFSRGGVAGLLIACAAVGVTGGAAAWRALLPAGAGFVAGAFGAVAWAIATHAPEALRFSLETGTCAGGVGNRGELWTAAWRMFLAHPIIGVGAGNFETQLPFYGVIGVRTHANSWYLQSLAEGGIALFATTIGLVVTVIRATLGGSRRSPWILAAFAATLALSMHQIVDYLVFYPKIGTAWWILVGIAAASF